jgi:hypothetical protein
MPSSARWSDSTPGGVITGQRCTTPSTSSTTAPAPGAAGWDQLFRTEKTHFGTLAEINLQR